MTEEYNNVLIVSYNPSNQSNKPLYQEIARALGSDLVEIAPSPSSKKSLEEICAGKLLRVVIHDGTTYLADPLLKWVRSKEGIPDSYIDTSIHDGQPCHPIMVYKGKDMGVRDVIRLLNLGVRWIFEPDDVFAPEHIRKIVERIEELERTL